MKPNISKFFLSPSHCRKLFNKGNRQVRRRILNLVSKIIRYCIGIDFLFSLWLVKKNLRPFLNQSDAKLKPIMTWSPAFSRAITSLVVYTLSSHWLLKYFPSLWLADMIFGLRHSNEKRSYVSVTQTVNSASHLHKNVISLKILSLKVLF